MPRSRLFFIDVDHDLMGWVPPLHFNADKLSEIVSGILESKCMRSSHALDRLGKLQAGHIVYNLAALSDGCTCADIIQ